jgi:hypothetical protein
MRQVVDGGVHGLQLGALIGGEVAGDRDHEVAVAHFVGVADGEGALQIEANQVLAENGPDVVGQVRQEGVEGGEWGDFARRGALVFAVLHGRSNC